MANVTRISAKKKHNQEQKSKQQKDSRKIKVSIKAKKGKEILMSNQTVH